MNEHEVKLVAAETRFAAIKKEHEDAYNRSDDTKEDDETLGSLSFEDGLPIGEAAESAINDAREGKEVTKELADAAEAAVTEFEDFARDYNGDDVVDGWLADD